MPSTSHDPAAATGLGKDFDADHEAELAANDERRTIEWWAENYWRQIRRLHKAYANLGCVDENGSAMHYTGEVGPKDCTCPLCTSTEGETNG